MKPDTSETEVIRAAEMLEAYDFDVTAALLRTLLAECDALRAQLADVLAENDAVRFQLNNANAALREAKVDEGWFAEQQRRAAEEEATERGPKHG